MSDVVVCLLFDFPVHLLSDVAVFDVCSSWVFVV